MSTRKMRLFGVALLLPAFAGLCQRMPTDHGYVHSLHDAHNVTLSYNDPGNDDPAILTRHAKRAQKDNLCSGRYTDMLTLAWVDAHSAVRSPSHQLLWPRGMADADWYRIVL